MCLIKTMCRYLFGTVIFTAMLFFALLPAQEAFSQQTTAGTANFFISIALSPSEPMRGDSIKVNVTVFPKKRTPILYYTDENKLGGNGFLKLLLLAPGGKEARFIHPAQYTTHTLATPLPKDISPEEPLRIETILNDWFDVSILGEYAIKAKYRILTKGNKGETAIVEIESLPIAFTIGEWNEETLKRAIEQGKSDARLAALKFMAKRPVRFEGCIGVLENYLAKGTEDERALSAAILGGLQEAGSLDAIIVSLLAAPPTNEANARLFMRGLSLLGKYRPTAIVEALEEATKDKMKNDFALFALLKAAFMTNAYTSAPIAHDLLENSNELVTIAAVDVVGKFRHLESYSRLEKIYQETASVPLKEAILTAFASFGDARAVPIFISALQSKDLALVTTSARYAGLLDDIRLAEYLLPLLKSDNFILRQYAYPSLARITGCKLPYNYDAPPKELAYQVEQWETWWGENRAKFFEPVRPDALNYVFSAFSLVIFITVAGHMLGFLRESSFTVFLKGGKADIYPREHTIFAHRRKSKEKKEKQEGAEL